MGSSQSQWLLSPWGRPWDFMPACRRTLSLPSPTRCASILNRCTTSTLLPGSSTQPRPLSRPVVLSILRQSATSVTGSLIRRNSLHSIRPLDRVADVENTEIKSFLPAPGGRLDRQRDSRSVSPVSRWIPHHAGPPLAHARSKTVPHSEMPRQDSLHPRPPGRVETLRGAPLPAQRLPQAS